MSKPKDNVFQPMVNDPFPHYPLFQLNLGRILECVEDPPEELWKNEDDEVIASDTEAGLSYLDIVFRELNKMPLEGLQKRLNERKETKIAKTKLPTFLKELISKLRSVYDTLLERLQEEQKRDRQQAAALREARAAVHDILQYASSLRFGERGPFLWEKMIRLEERIRSYNSTDSLSHQMERYLGIQLSQIRAFILANNLQKPASPPSKRSTKGRKPLLAKADRKKIRKEFHERERDGENHMSICDDLSKRYDVSETTIRRIAGKRKD